MNRIVAVLERLGRGPILIVLGFAFLAIAVPLFVSSASFSIPTVEHTCGSSPPDTRLHTTAVELDQFLDECGTDGRRAYRNLQIVDLAYPLISGMAMASLMAFVLKRLSGSRRRLLVLAALPLVAALFDYGENAMAWIALERFPNLGVEADLLGVVGTAKQATTYIAGLLLLIAAIAVVTSWLGRKLA